jgi:hypothetical protein
MNRAAGFPEGVHHGRGSAEEPCDPIAWAFLEGRETAMKIRALPATMLVVALVAGTGVASAQEGYRIEAPVSAWTISDDDVSDAYPNGVAYDPGAGLVFVAVNGYYGQHVQVFGPSGEPVTEFGEWGSGPGQFRRLNDVAVDSTGLAYVADDLNQRVQVFQRSATSTTPTFEYLREFPAVFHEGGWRTYPYKLSFGPGGDLYVGGYWAYRAMRYSSAGDLLQVFGPYDYRELPIAATADAAGNAWVATLYAPPRWTLGDNVYQYDDLGDPLDVWALHGRGDGQVWTVVDILITADGIVYLADQEGCRVVVFTTTGEFLGWYGKGTATTGWHEPGSGEIGQAGSGPGEFDRPRALSLDPAGILYVADYGTRRIQALALERTPQQLAEAIQGALDALLQGGTINGGQHTALTGKVTKALERYEAGRGKAGLNMLRAFVNQVTDLVASGVLSDEDGRTLLELADRLVQKMSA